MLGKTDWNTYLHAIRKQEIAIVFSMLNNRRFAKGLELGAGDGYQTTYLTTRCDEFVSSDLNFDRLKQEYRVEGASYKKLDADNLAGVFPDRSFDFIFSSNMLEHLGNRESFLRETHRMLTDDGIAVHIVPGRWMKVSYLFLFYPHLCTVILDRLIGVFKGKKVLRGKHNAFENNINTIAPRKTWFQKIFLPSIHGNYVSHRSEFVSWGKHKWFDMFTVHNFSVAGYAKGPVFSGYGFGVRFLQKWLGRLGMTSEHIFLLKKMDSFERLSRDHTAKALPHAYFYEREKFIKDWIGKKDTSRQFLLDFIRDVGDPKDTRVLDVGFGNGIILSEFAAHGAYAYGVEIEKDLYEIAKQMLEKRGTSAQLFVYNGTQFPFDQNFFDYAYSTSVLEHMSYPDIVIKEVARVLKPGGRFYLSFPNKYNLKESHTGLWGISLFPRWVTKVVLRIVGSKALEDWNLHFISFFDMKRMAHRAGLRLVIDTSAKTPTRRLIKKALARLGIHYGILLKTIIVVLEKPKER